MKYVLGLGVAVVVIISFAFFWLFSDSDLKEAQDQMDEAAQQLEEQPSESASKADMSGFGTMNELLSRESNLECQITTIENSATSEGTFFVADNKIRGDFITESPDLSGVGVSSIIVVDNTMYVWTELGGESYGVKAQLKSESEEAMPTQEPVKLDERVKYACKKWEPVDQSVFIPPSDVLFQDLSQVLQEGMEYGTVYEEGTAY
jgi:hypothetical protein